MPELVAWHVDRLMGFYRKPPIASRTVPSNLLYPSFLGALLPSYDVPVSVHGWLEDMRKEDPPLSIMPYLAGAS